MIPQEIPRPASTPALSSPPSIVQELQQQRSASSVSSASTLKSSPTMLGTSPPTVLHHDNNENSSNSSNKGQHCYPVCRQKHTMSQSEEAASHTDSWIDVSSVHSLPTPALGPQEIVGDDVPSDMSHQSKQTNGFHRQQQQQDDRRTTPPVDDNVDERGNPAACIFVASLTKAKNDEELNISVSKHFEQWGDLLNVKVLKDWMGRPYAFVQFVRTQDALVALSKAPGTLLDGRNIRCEPARVNRTLCITSCGPPLIVEEIQAEVAQYGKIENITVLHGYPTPNGGLGDCAFVKYNYRDDAIKSFINLSKMTQKWWVEWASNLDTAVANVPVTRPSALALQSSRHLNDRKSIFIGNLLEEVTEDELKGRFKQYGSIEYARIIRKTYPFKCTFAFIRYKEDSEANNAIQAENGLKWCNKKIRVAYREPRDSALLFGGGVSGAGGYKVQYGRTAMERPHPPGLGHPASDHQYLVSSPGGKQRRPSATNGHINNRKQGGTGSSSSERTGLKKSIHGEKHATDETHQQSQQQLSAVSGDGDADAGHEQHQQRTSKDYNVSGSNKSNNKGCRQQQQQCITPPHNTTSAGGNKTSTTPPPPGYSGYYSNHQQHYPQGGSGGSDFYHHPLNTQQHNQYVMPAHPPTAAVPGYYDPNMYCPLPPGGLMYSNPEDHHQQQPVMMLGSMQGTTSAPEAKNGTISSGNNMFYVPGYYDYSGTYYPCYSPVPTAPTGLAPTTSMGAGAPSLTSANAANGPFVGNGLGSADSGNKQQQQQQQTLRSSVTGGGYYYMLPPTPHHSLQYPQAMQQAPHTGPANAYICPAQQYNARGYNNNSNNGNMHSLSQTHERPKDHSKHPHPTNKQQQHSSVNATLSMDPKNRKKVNNTVPPQPSLQQQANKTNDPAGTTGSGHHYHHNGVNQAHKTIKT
ncbi:hypothetical protein BDB00DRAFT_924870 [Zychaea mexicana]|uniref:uncharacterized protein n=1 Tax=Zychaea mexicana TaxID=64656 RepID=UPI0022FF1EDF|nr:uncharacterized protein BDB00DRAFT_924870 [Zychaea mexicana]KAI9498544.1 hypothetical protein BDB00DRAFT_924870 [Zychaea mexicana]